MSFGLYAPGLDIITTGIAREIALFDPSLVVVFNKRCYQNRDGSYSGRFEIYDKNAPGGPKWQLVLRVPLTEDGHLRWPDQREMDALRQARGRTVKQLLDEFDVNAEKREAEAARVRGNIAAEMADDVKYLGQKITPSVESRNRAREAIRAVAS